jgi:quercetin dioxygenase-like cupin family protein
LPLFTHSERVTIRRNLIAGAAAFCGACLFAATVHATPAEGDVVRTDLAKGSTDAPVSIVTDGTKSTLIVQSLLLRPASNSGWHAHPGPEYSAITAGTVAVQTATDCVVTQYGAGQAVFIPAGVAHRVANDSAQDAEVVVTYTVPADVTVREDAPDACAK